MIPKEAIKYLEADKSGVVFNEQARQLGIEALKREEWYRENNPDIARFRLFPGETEE